MYPLLSTLLWLAPASASPAAAPADVKTKVDAVFHEYDRSDSPGCVLGVYRDGKIAYERGFGMANLELGIANSPQSVFDIGSTSKQFTAFSIHLLAREGKLSLDDDIRKWIPEVPSYGKTVTIRHLLHHTSGLRDYIEVMSLQGMQEEDWTTEADALAAIARQKAPNFAPGDDYLYSNSGFFLLGVIVKRASGQSLRDFAQARIFGPLGMRHTQFNDSHNRIVPNRATGYSKADGGGGFDIDMGDWEQVGDGAVQTTVEDLQLWDQNFYEPRVGDRALLDEMLTVGVLNSGKKLTYASALVRGTYRGLPTVSHGGAWVGYRAQLLRFPQQHFSVASLCNLAEANPTALAYGVADVYLAAQLQPVEAPKPAAKAAAPVKVSAADLQRLAGGYREPSSFEVFTLDVRQGQLEGKWGRRTIRLVPTASGRFRLEGFSAGPREVEVLSAPAGAGSRPKLRLSWTEDGEKETETYEPVTLWSPTAAEVRTFAGRYTSEEIDTTWTLAVDGDQLFIRHRGLPEDPLRPTVDGVFVVRGIMLAFQKDATGRVTGFTVNEGRARDIAFRKI
jgi:CubicO group peptidase (beta-lactamase class C family)